MTEKGTQLDLFGEPTPPRAERGRTRALGPLPEPSPELVALAERLPRGLRMGTSSWTFPGWRGHVYRREYPSEKVFVQRSLEEYARFPLFRTVGIDRSFWAPIPEPDLAAYAAQLPEGFRCVMKVWEEITTLSYPAHPRYGERAGQLNPGFLDVEAFRSLVADPVARAFAEHLGMFLLEIPPPTRLPDRAVFERTLVRFFESVPREFRYAIELRDRRLFSRRHLELLRAHDVGHVWNLWSRMPSLRAQWETAGGLPDRGPVIARLMLPVGASYEQQEKAFAPYDRLVAPDSGMRADVETLARSCEERGLELYVIVNNKVEGSSPWTVRALAERLARNVG